MPPRHHVRICKYDPASRDEAGRYLPDEWTAFSDIGTSFEGVVLTRAAYQQVEDAYVDSALACLTEAGIAWLEVRDLEHRHPDAQVFEEGDQLDHAQLAPALRAVLREQAWCAFETDDASVHVGWDYYMYVGTPRPCPASIAAAEARGLFVESTDGSPYSDRRR